MPCEEERNLWFLNLKNGIGTLGNEECIWLDFDVKHFTDEVECHVKAWAIAAKVKELSGHEPTLERTHSGGWRVCVYVEEKPTFTNFALEPGGKYVGEALGTGRFTVLAPTVGPSGNHYVTYHRHSPESKPLVRCLEDIGVYPASKKSKAKTPPDPASTPKPKPTSVPGSVCLSDLACPNVQNILRGDNVKGDRSALLATALNELHGWQRWCQENGKTFTEDAEALAYEAGQRMGIDADRIGRILKTIDANACTPAAYHKGGDEPCLKHYERLASGRSYAGGIGSGSGGSGGNGKGRGTGGSGGSGDGGDGNGGDDNGKVVKFPGADPETQEWIFNEIDAFIAQGVSGSLLTGKLNRLAAASQIYVGELRKLYQERLNESDLEIERDDNRDEIENRLRTRDEDLDLNDYLPPELADPLTLWCKWLSIRNAVALTALLTGASSLHQTGTTLKIHQDLNYDVPSTLFSAMIGPSGQLKTPILRNIITQPLNIIAQEKVDAYNAAMEDYKAALKAWQAAGSDGDEPEKPKEPTLYYFNDTTGEGLYAQAARDPGKALFGVYDELSGLFAAQNAYRSNGKGSERQDLLSYYDGTGKTVLRKPGVQVREKCIYLSLFGGIQLEVLKPLMGDFSDPDGQWARFLFVHQPLQAMTLPDDGQGAVRIHERIVDFYRKIDRLPEMEYHLSQKAFKRYQSVLNRLDKLRVTHPKAGMRAIYAKLKGQIGRLALNLHVLWEIAQGKACPDEEIPLYVMEMAIRLANFYFRQVKLIHADADEESVPTQILRLVELSKRLDVNGKDGWIKAQTYREQFASKKRPSGQQARDWMIQAVSLGYGRTRGTGNRLEYHWKSGGDDGDYGNFSPTTPPDLGNLGKLREDLGNTLPYVEALENKGVDANLGNLGKGTPNNSLTPTVEDSLRPSDTSCADVRESNVEAITPETAPNCGEPITSTFTEKSLEGGSVPEASLTSLSEPSSVDVESDTHLGKNLGNPFPNSSLTSLSEAKTEDKGEDLTATLTLAHHMRCVAVPPDVEALRASFSGEAIEAAKDLLADEERELFEAIANGCANLSPAVAELAHATPDVTPNLLGRRILGKNSSYTSFGKLFTISRQEEDICYFLDGNEEKYLDLSEIGSTWELLEYAKNPIRPN
jgi:hypothetical protein